MAVYTTIATAVTKNANDPTAYVGGVGYPGDGNDPAGDTVLLDNNITLVVPAGVTLAWGTPATLANAVSGVTTGKTGKLRVDGTLKLYGHLATGNAVQTVSPGGILEIQNDAAHGGAIKIQLGDGGSQANARLVVGDAATGSASNRAIVRSKVAHSASTPAGYITSFSTNARTGQVDADYADFVDLGSASQASLSPRLGNSADTFTFDHCTFTRCGQITVTSATVGSQVAIRDCLFAGSKGTYAVQLASCGAYTSGLREILRTDFDRTINLFASEAAIEGNSFDCASGTNGVLFTGTTPFAAQGTLVGNFIVRRGGALNLPVGYLGWTYWVWGSPEATNNQQAIVPRIAAQDGAGNITSAVDSTIDGHHIDGWGLNATSSSGDAIANAKWANTTPGRVQRVIHCTMGRCGASATAFKQGKFYSLYDSPGAGGYANVALEHNTVITEDLGESGLGCWGETWTTPPAGTISSMRHNLAVTLRAGHPGIFFSRINSGTAQDVVLAANVENNAGEGLSTGTDGYGLTASVTTPTATMFSGTPPVVASVAASLTDAFRDVGAYDTLCGGPGTLANFLAELRKRNDPTATYNASYAIASLYAWVRAGFAPQNAALQTNHASDTDTAVTQGWIGAIAGATNAGAAADRLAYVRRWGMRTLHRVAARFSFDALWREPTAVSGTMLLAPVAGAPAAASIDLLLMAGVEDE